MTKNSPHGMDRGGFRAASVTASIFSIGGLSNG